MPLEQIRVRIYGHPLYLNEQREYDKLFNPWGAYVLEIDAGTYSGYDVRFVRVKLEVCDRSLIPAKHLLPYRNPNGQRKVHDLEFEIKSDKSETLNAWARRKGGRQYPNGTEFGQTLDPAVVQPPPPPPNTGEGGFVVNGNGLVLRNNNRVFAFETINLDVEVEARLGTGANVVETNTQLTEEVVVSSGVTSDQHNRDVVMMMQDSDTGGRERQ